MKSRNLNLQIKGLFRDQENLYPLDIILWLLDTQGSYNRINPFAQAKVDKAVNVVS